MNMNMNMHSIEISFDNGRICVDPDNLLVKPGDDIEWTTNPKGEPFMVFFRDGPPFKGEKLNRADKGPLTRKVAGKGDKVRAYKYSVIFHDEMLDPIIIVDWN